MTAGNNKGGSKYKNIKGNIVESSGTGSFAAGGNISIGGNVYNKIEKEYDQDTAKALAEVAEHVNKSRDPAAGLLFKSFTDELNQPQPDKSKLKSFWSGIEKAVPAINTIAGVAAKIVPLFT